MAKRRERRVELEAENRFLRRGQWIRAISGTANRIVTVGGFVLIAYFVRDSIVALAGEKTIADIGVSFLGHVGVSESFAWMTALLCSGYGYAQRTMRRKTEARMGGRIRELEQGADPNRSSSELPDGGGGQ